MFCQVIQQTTLPQILNTVKKIKIHNKNVAIKE